MSQPAATAADNPSPVASFFVHARAEPGVMPRVLELFAKRGLVPLAFHSRICGPGDAELTIDIQMPGLDRDTVDYMAACMRQIASVETVLTARG
jgi:acetolactate synthase small subunit